MKILFDHSLPFALAHGGLQIQIEETKAALERRGHDIDFVRWWDIHQKADVIHLFGAPAATYLKRARQHHVATVVTHLFSAACNRPLWRLKLQGTALRLLSLFPQDNLRHMGGEAFRLADRLVVGLQAEARVFELTYHIPAEKIATVPLGVHPDFLKVTPLRNQPFLITTGTITEVKRSLELARMARDAETPLLFVGKSLSPDDPYWHEFKKLIDGRFVLHRDHVWDRQELIELIRSSRGFVIYSKFENWCLAAHEAAACGLPVLLPDLSWSRERFGDQAHYLASEPGKNAERLRAFYDACPNLPAPDIRIYSWDDVAEQLEKIYLSLDTGR